MTNIQRTEQQGVEIRGTPEPGGPSRHPDHRNFRNEADGSQLRIQLSFVRFGHRIWRDFHWAGLLQTPMRIVLEEDPEAP